MIGAGTPDYSDNPWNSTYLGVPIDQRYIGIAGRSRLAPTTLAYFGCGSVGRIPPIHTPYRREPERAASTDYLRE
jgi:hypothetical protein